MNRLLFFRKFTTKNNFSYLNKSITDNIKSEIKLEFNKQFNANNNLIDDMAIFSILKNDYPDLNCIELDNKIKELKILNNKNNIQKNLLELNNKIKYIENNNINNELYNRIKYYYILIMCNNIK